MDFKKSLYKFSTLSLSALMGLSLGAPALSVNASQRPVRHARTVRPVQLSKRDRAIIRRDQIKISQIKRQISADEAIEYRNNARSLYRQLRRFGFSYTKSIVILTVAREETGGAYKSNSNYGFFGIPMNGHGRKSVDSYAQSRHENPQSITVQLGYMHRYLQNGYTFRTDRTKGAVKLYQNFNRRILHAPARLENKRTMSSQLRATQKLLDIKPNQNSQSALRTLIRELQR